MSEPLASCLYVGEVVHQRVRPRRHRLRYSVFSALFSLDELPRLDRRLKLFGHNRFNIFSFLDRDHGEGTGAPLRPWVEHHLERAGIALAGGDIRILCYPRLFGLVFNPLSVYYCHRADGALAAMIYEVNNTFGERHSYLIPVDGVFGGELRQVCAKRFYVSPFIAMQGEYRFRLNVPGETLTLVINQSDAEGPLLHAAFTGRRQGLSDAVLLRMLARFPLMTLKVVMGIRWEALRLWRKGVPLVDRPAPPAEPVTLVRASLR